MSGLATFLFEWYDLVIPGRNTMGTAVKKTISLPPELARAAQEMAREQGRTLSAVVQDALRLAARERLRTEFAKAQGYWGKRAREKGILTEKDLEKYLG
jgi:predicted transcriptional regulator